MSSGRGHKRLADWVLVALMVVLFAGCEIEETKPEESGSVTVTLADTSGAVISGARVRVDGRDTPRYTPAVLNDLPVGVHSIGAFKPGYADTSIEVEIRLNEMTVADLSTMPIEGGSIDLIGAPEGTVLLLNNIPAGVVPTAAEFPTLFERLGVGVYRATAYLPGHATELPAQWTVQLAASATVALTPLFVPMATSAEVGGLAPAFQLPCDWDSSLYRLQDYRGQVVLVTFFFSNCTACVEEFPYIAALYEDPAVAGKVQFLGVDFVDSYPAFARFRAEHPTLGISFPLLRDARQTVPADYGVSICPANVIVDPSGRVRLHTGGISEPLLRQTVFQLLEQAGGPTFAFTMRDTLLNYTDGNQTFTFHGRVENLLNAQRTFVLNITPIVSPDTSRVFSICTYRGCYAPRSGSITLHEVYGSLQVDTLLSFDIYNEVNDGGPVDSAVVGDYLLRAAIYPADNAGERVEYDLRLDDLRTAGSVLAAVFAPLPPASPPQNKRRAPR
jgi:peroxiredoxin